MRNAIIILLIACCTLSTSYATTLIKESKNLKATTYSDERPKFRIGFDAPQIDHRQLLLTIDPNTTDGVDYGYDAEMYQMIEDDMYWLLDSNKYVIQATNEVIIDKEIPLGIIMSASGNIEIKVDELENPMSDLVVYLKDLELNKFYNIQDSVFRTILPQGEHHSKFVITFKSVDYINETPTVEEPIEDDTIVEDETESEDGTNDIIGEPIIVPVDSVSVPEVVADNCSNIKKRKLQVFYNKRSASIVIKNKCEVDVKKVTLFNRRGRRIKVWKREFNRKRISLPIVVKKGMYFIHVKTNETVLRKRLLIK
ncbi:Por secretion system C-terminal sorting domain-containing protein [Lutibacter oricola]|uniref:Por secretion system C-terminal sorting domain-containing protein n=1 Tax=Lutibacter oricola TaxID=762486 RepID=A0A1H2QGL5_9FLAO|nr:T9SS type A sorting domain-containing protein [Lutibacter oricola]SDW06373.1 Por secretion system C-terminal sorting domain-containing protein [Lutibacter oricola]